MAKARALTVPARPRAQPLALWVIVLINLRQRWQEWRRARTRADEGLCILVVIERRWEIPRHWDNIRPHR